MWKADAEFNRRCGEILEIQLNVEDSLDHFISCYEGYVGSYAAVVGEIKITYPTNASSEKIHEIARKILPKMRFNDKIRRFEEICKKENVGEEGYLPIVAKMDSWEAIRKFGRLNKQQTLLPQGMD